MRCFLAISNSHGFSNNSLQILYPTLFFSNQLSSKIACLAVNFVRLLWIHNIILVGAQLLKVLDHPSEILRFFDCKTVMHDTSKANETAEYVDSSRLTNLSPSVYCTVLEHPVSVCLFWALKIDLQFYTLYVFQIFRDLSEFIFLLLLLYNKQF